MEGVVEARYRWHLPARRERMQERLDILPHAPTSDVAQPRQVLRCLLSSGILFAGLIVAFGLRAPVAIAAQTLRVVAAQTAAETGVISALADDFKASHPDVDVKIQSVGALATLDIARRGGADLVITHFPPAEEVFVTQGYGLLRTTIMYNEFAIVGPVKDPLKLSQEPNLMAALRRLAEEQVTFYAPGNRSGTSNTLNQLWQLAGVDPNWVGYEVTDESSAATLQNAALFGTYAFVDLGTYLAHRDKVKDELAALYRDNLLLRNYYSAIVVNKERIPNVNQMLAEQYLDYLVSDRAQQLIARYGDEKYHTDLFTPAATLDEGLQTRRAQAALINQTRNFAIAISFVLGLFVLSVGTTFFYLRARKLEKIHRRSEERFKLAVAGTNDGIWDWEIFSNHTYFSPRLLNILGIEDGDKDKDIGNLLQLLKARVHPDDFDSVSQRLQLYMERGKPQELFLMEFRIRAENNDTHWIMMRGRAIRGPLGDAVRLSGSFTEITERKRQEAAIAHQAVHDALTELPNRVLLEDRLKHALQTTARHRVSLALIVMDLNRFKDINDTLGHHVGDLILRQVALRLRHILRPNQTVARLGGDEFAVLLPEADVTYANHVAEKILLALKKVFDLGHHSLYIGASLGIALFPDHGGDAETLTRHADVAMYNAKRSNSGYAFYDPQHDRHSVTRLALEKELQEAIANSTLELHYQPIFDLQSSDLVGVEALLRWNHPQRGPVAPDQIIPVAEETGLIKPLTRWVLNTAIYQCYDWRRKGIEPNIAINLSVWNIQDPELLNVVREAVETLNIPPSKLEFEITESAMMADPERAIEVLTALHKMGIKLVIDDFGTGFSSLAYLKRLPVHALKIDKSFVIGMADDADDAMIVKSTVNLAHDLGLKVVAEGIETEETVKLLRHIGCDYGQGYFLGRPARVADLVHVLRRRLEAIPAVKQ